MRHLALLLLAAGFLVLSAAPASAEPHGAGRRPHWNCPDGITLYSGGSPAFKLATRQAATEWNTVMGRRAHRDIYRNTRFSRIIDWDWNGLAWGHNAGPPPGPCVVDVDQYHAADGAAGLAFSTWGGGGFRTHTLSGAVMFNGRYDQGEYRNYVVALHELAHTLGLGHSRRCDSVMGTCYRPWISSEDWNSLGALYIHGH